MPSDEDSNVESPVLLRESKGKGRAPSTPYPARSPPSLPSSSGRRSSRRGAGLGVDAVADGDFRGRFSRVPGRGRSHNNGATARNATRQLELVQEKEEEPFDEDETVAGTATVDEESQILSNNPTNKDGSSRGGKVFNAMSDGSDHEDLPEVTSPKVPQKKMRVEKVRCDVSHAGCGVRTLFSLTVGAMCLTAQGAGAWHEGAHGKHHKH